MIRSLTGSLLLIFAILVTAHAQSNQSNSYDSQYSSDTTYKDNDTTSEKDMWDYIGDTSYNDYGSDNNLPSVIDDANQYIADGDYDMAAILLEDYIYEDSLDADAWHLLGAAYDNLYGSDTAMFCYHRAIDINPLYACPYSDLAYIFDYKAQYDSMNYYMLEAIIFSDNPESLYYDYGYSFAKLNQDDSALTYYHKALYYNPQDKDACLNIGAIWDAKGYIDSSEVYTWKVLQLDPNSPLGNYNYGQIRAFKGDTTGAIGFYQLAYASDPTMVKAKMRLGDMYSGLNDIVNARKYYQEFLDQAGPDNQEFIDRVKAKLYDLR